MNFDDFAGLKAAVAAFLGRSDLTEQIPGFIALAEAQMKRDLRRTTKRKTITLAGSSWNLDADVKELRSIRLVTSSPSQDRPFRIGTPEQLAESRAARGDAVGRPAVGAVVGRELLFTPATDGLYDAEITYFEALVPLSDENPTNSVLEEAPDAYLFGALKEAETYMENDERVVLWEKKYQTAIDSLVATRQREEYSASLRPARLPRVF